MSANQMLKKGIAILKSMEGQFPIVQPDDFDAQRSQLEMVGVDTDTIAQWEDGLITFEEALARSRASR